MSEKNSDWDFEPKHELLDSVSEFSGDGTVFNAALNVHGMYETMKFVLRLSPRNHELVDEITAEGRTAPISPEGFQAYSTYLHETVHWWQHVGSTSGLLLSLSYLGQTHGSLGQLRQVLAVFGPKKSLKQWAEQILVKEGPAAQAKLAAANIAVNNAQDIEYYKIYAMNAKKSAQWLYEQKYFQAIGHNYAIAYGQLVGMLADTVDPEHVVIPAAKNWDSEFERLEKSRHEGFYWGSPMRVPAIGLHAIYEGQARFIQLQFLDTVYSNAPTIDEWRSLGYLSGIYVQAFEHFLLLSESEWPKNVDDPIVGLFLLICDLSINPTRGFPLEIVDFENFINDVDVGIRFTCLSKAASQMPHLKSAITEYSREEYIAVSAELSDRIGYDRPLDALTKIVGWLDTEPGIQALMAEHKTFEFDQVNLPLRVFFSHFLSFAKDKLARPEFFCWAGYSMVDTVGSGENRALWIRHLSLFSDKADKPGVYPRNWPDREKAAIQKTFESFYSSMVAYDLTRQWTLQDGEFRCEFEWLAKSYSQEDADRWADVAFKQVYGVSLKDFEVFPAQS